MRRLPCLKSIVILILFCLGSGSLFASGTRDGTTWDFTNLDGWSTDSWDWEGNGSHMSGNNVCLTNGMLCLTVSSATSRGKRFSGSEVRSLRTFNYGKFTVRMKNRIKSGTVSSFFVVTPWREDGWIQKEIDIEFLGKDPSSVQFTVHHRNTGTGKHEFYPTVHKLAFDTTAAFHEYAIEWKKDSISWFVDGQCLRTETRIVPDQPLLVLMNHWVPDPQMNWAEDWVGKIVGTDLPSAVLYDEVRYVPAE